MANTLRVLRATGWNGFEGLVATLLSQLTGRSLLLASSGLQSGLDTRTSHKSEVLIAVECKRYHEDTPLSQRELLAEIDAAVMAHPKLDCWILAATRPISAQEESVLQAACSNRGIEYLTLGCATIPNVELLDALCASQAPRALEYLKAAGARDAQIEAFSQAAAYILSQSETVLRVEELRRQLSVASLGFSAFRDNLNRRLAEDLSEAARCKQRFRCALGPHALPAGVTAVPRPTLLARLDELWRDALHSPDRRAVVVLGEEGDGKSWVVADWAANLISTPDAPAVFFFSAQEPTSSITDTLDFHAHEYGNLKGAPDVRRLLDRWLLNVRQRRAVVIFDGLNERLDRTLWSDLVSSALQDYGASIFLVLTCRRQTWQTVYLPVMLHKLVELSIGPFDDQEFAQALSGLSADYRNALIGLGPLVRRPRYFHCACEHALKLGSTHELSIPLLYYLDWKHRHSRRPLLSLNTEDFEQGLMELARRQYEATRASHPPAGADLLSNHGFHPHLEELSSGGVLRQTGPFRRWQVEKPYLALGLGMYLASLLEERGGSIDERCELASVTLGDTSSWELTGDVMQQALQHALRVSPAFSIETQIAILTVWSQCLNALEQAAQSLPQMAVLQPELIFGFADRAWRDGNSDHLIETAVLEALIRILRDPDCRKMAESRLCRWTGAVHPFGESSCDDDDPHIHRLVDVDRLCASDSCVLPSSRVVLYREPQRTRIRLGRLALAALSACDRRTYWQALVTAMVASEAMGGDRSDVLAWVIRSSAQPLDDLIDATVTELLGDHEVVSNRAARKMLRFLGSPTLMDRLDAIPPDPTPHQHPFQTEYDADPCNCFFIAPPRSLFLGCLSRTDVPYSMLAGRAKSLAADRDVEFPAVFADRVRSHAKTLDVSKLRLQIETDSEDLKWQDIEPLLCRIDPNLLADIVRQFAMTAATREGMPLRQLSWSIDEYGELLGSQEIAALRSAWERHSAALLAGENLQLDSRDARFVESMLAKSILRQLSANEQLDFLLSRPQTSSEVLSMEETFKAMPVEEQLQRILSVCGNIRSVRIALWFLGAQSTINVDVAVLLIQEALRGSDSVAKGLGLALLQRIDRARWSEISDLENWADNSSALLIERFYGTSMVLQSTSPSSEALGRCCKHHIGSILASIDGPQAEPWAACYTDLLAQTMRHLVANALPVPAHPAFDIATGDKHHPWQRLSTSQDRSSGVSLVSYMSTWGGLKPGGAKDFAAAFGNDADDDTSNASLETALDAAASQGDWLFAAHIPHQAIARIVHSCSWFIGEFEAILGRAEAAHRMGRIQPVVEAMAAWGMRSNHVGAERWLDNLDNSSSSVTYKDTVSGLSSRKAALLAAPKSPLVESRWRAELQNAHSDHELYHVIYTLDANGHRQWLQQEAAAHMQSGSPRGRAMCISMLSALDDGGRALSDMLVTVPVPPSSWYSDLVELGSNFRQRGEDYRHWILEAASHDDPVVRVCAAHLMLQIEDLRAPAIRANLLGAVQQEAIRDRLRCLPSLGDRNGRSEWAKSLNERLFGMKQLKHAVAPWLPVPPSLQRQ